MREWLLRKMSAIMLDWYWINNRWIIVALVTQAATIPYRVLIPINSHFIAQRAGLHAAGIIQNEKNIGLGLTDCQKAERCLR